MAFMASEIYEGDYYTVETNEGTFIVPVDVAGFVRRNSDLRDYVVGKLLQPKSKPQLLHGWLARLSAPGYLDCTDWTAYDSEQEAIDGLRDLYGDDD